MITLLIVIGILLAIYLFITWFIGFLIWDLDAQKFNGEAMFFIFIIVPLTIAIYLMFSLLLLSLYGIKKFLTKEQDPHSLRL